VRRLVLTCLLLLFVTPFAGVGNANPPPLLLANVLRDDIDVTQYWVSEKLDGVRAVWNGRELRFRSGRLIAAPAWFTERFPDQPLDREL
jgi:DNA ligase 1